jgi:hypothetical protein
MVRIRRLVGMFGHLCTNSINEMQPVNRVVQIAQQELGGNAAKAPSGCSERQTQCMVHAITIARNGNYTVSNVHLF